MDPRDEDGNLLHSLSIFLDSFQVRFTRKPEYTERKLLREELT